MMASFESDESDFEGFTSNDIEDFDDNGSEIGSDISISPVSTPESSDAEISEDESDDEVEIPQQWTENLSQFTVADFKEEVGSKIELGPLKTEREFFLQFFPEMLVEKMVAETNNYAKMMTQQKPDPKWNETSMAEMWAFLGIFIVLSVMQIPRYSLGWGMSKFFGIPGLPSVMTRERFERICKYFHLNDTRNNPPKGQDGHDKLVHIRPFIDAIQEKCLGNYNPPKEQSIDEGMIAFKGRLSFRQYLPAKPTKFGIKVWARGHPRTGYISEFQIYVGKPDGKKGKGVGEEGLGARVIKDLTAKIQNRNHHIYMDNYFSSPKLFDDLRRVGLYCCGTVRTNRKGMPPAMKNTKDLKKQGDSKIFQKGELVCVGWKDRKVVHILFNNMDPSDTCMVVRREKDGRRKEVRCPKVAETYSRNKGGVDLADQNRTQYSSCRKAKKWWKYLFWFLFDTAICNALVCMKESPNHQLKTKTGKAKSRTQLDFRMNLAKQFISGYQGTRKRKIVENIDTEGDRHWPGRFAKRGRCKLCSKEGRRHEVFLGCKQCNVHLCVDNDCFQRYHTQMWK